MNAPNRTRAHRPPSRQRGLSTLLIAILLLAIVTIITLFAARFGIFEQRMSANDYRYKMAFQASEAGLNQSMEFIKMSTAEMLSTVDGGWLFPGDPLWQPCSEALPGGMALDPCLAEPDVARRADMYRFVGDAGDGILPVTDLMPALDMGDAVAGDDHVEEFAAEYSSYATLCRLDITVPESPRCALNPTTGDTFYVTVVSQGTLPDENATVTVKQSFGTFRTLGAAPDAPLIAAGTAVGLGNSQIIPNPDAGGTGVPVSIWSKGDASIADAGSFSTCQLGEWLTTADPEDAISGICEDCSCNGLDFGYGLLSGHEGGDKFEGEDILDVDGHDSEASPKVRDSKYFPPDLFAYVFSVPDSEADDFLNSNATILTSCDELDASSGGLYWWNSTADCSIGDVIGSLTDPVVLVSNGKVTMNAKAQFFGIVYVRDTVTGDLFKATGGGQVYGSVILEGDANLAGTPQIIYNEAVLRNIRNSPNFLRYGPVPGSWSDTLE
jgi:hypothetical protein